MDSEKFSSATSPPQQPNRTADLSREETAMSALSKIPTVRAQWPQRQAQLCKESNRLGEARPSKPCTNSTTTKITLDKIIYTRIGTEDKEEDPTASRPADSSIRTAATMLRNPSKKWMLLTRSPTRMRTVRTLPSNNQVIARAWTEANRAPQNW